jgi:hypothetical protein
MKTSLIAITLIGLGTGFALASPRSIHQRSVEKARDASKAAAEAQAQNPAPAPAPASPAAPVKGQAQAPSQPAATPAPAPAPSGPSSIARDGKPPSSRFFNRLRTDASRNASKAQRDATAAASATADPKAAKDLIYRHTWGPRSRSRPR